jgi:hypothetical protein
MFLDFILIFFSSLFSILGTTKTNNLNVDHKRHVNCSIIEDRVCGKTNCKECSSSVGKFERPENILYNYAAEKVYCVSDRDCSKWQLCLYVFKTKADFYNWLSLDHFCVDSFSFSYYESNLREEITEIIEKSDNISENIRNSSVCVNKRKIILNVNKSGFGNRIMSIIAGIQLSIMTNRTLYIIWFIYRIRFENK